MLTCSDMCVELLLARSVQLWPDSALLYTECLLVQSSCEVFASKCVCVRVFPDVSSVISVAITVTI